MKKSALIILALLSLAHTAIADTTYTLTAQTITKFQAYTTNLNFETNGFDESTCDDESIKLGYNSISTAELFSLLKEAAQDDTVIKTVQYFWDSSEEDCYLRYIELY